MGEIERAGPVLRQVISAADRGEDRTISVVDREDRDRDTRPDRRGTFARKLFECGLQVYDRASGDAGSQFGRSFKAASANCGARAGK